MGSISHDLRTPLNCITNLLQSAKFDARFSKVLFKEYISPSINSCAYLLNLVNDILDFTQISVNKRPKMNYEPANVHKTIKDIVSLMKLKAELRNINLIYQISSRVPESFFTDPRRLKQILINLVGNAIKFTFKGEIKITA